MTQKVFSLQRFWQARADSAKLFAQVEVAQLAARRSRNPKVGSSILSRRSSPQFIHGRLLSARHWRFHTAPGGASPRSQHIRIKKRSSRGTLYSVSAGARMIITRSNLAQDQQTQIHKVRAQKHAHQKPHNELCGQPRAPKAKSQEPKAKSQVPHKRSLTRKRTHRGM